MQLWPYSATVKYRDAAQVCVLALALGAFHLGTRSILLDESTSIEIARVGIASLPGALMDGDPNMRLFYVLLTFWVKIFGESEAAVRSLPLIFGALGAGAVCLLGTRLFGRAAGVLAGILFALDAFIVQYAQTARGYSLLVFLVTLSSLLLVVEHDRTSRRARIGYVLVTTLAIYAHFFAALVLLAHAVVIILLRRREYLTVEWARAGAAIVLLCVPAALSAIHAGPHAISWIERPSPRDVAHVLADLAGDSQLLVLAFLSCALYVTVSAMRRRDSAAQLFLMTWLVLPIVASYAVSFIQPVFQSNYLIICVPPLVIFAGAAVGNVRNRVATAVIAAALVGMSALQLVSYYGRAMGQDWRSASLHVLRSARPGDAIVFYPTYAEKPYDYYARRYAEAGKAQPRMQQVPTANRTWLVIRESDAALNADDVRQLQSSLRRFAHLAERREFHRVGVELYVR